MILDVSHNSEASKILRSIDIQIIDDDECDNRYQFKKNPTLYSEKWGCFYHHMLFLG